MINAGSPVYNTIIFYIILIIIILITKPDFMYCKDTKKFKPFGCSNGQTVLSFPIISITSVIVLYLMFLMLDVVNGYLEK